MKLNPVRSILEGRRVVLVDDSIVRGTTSRKIVKMVRAAGAQRSAHADQLSADDLAVLLRRRYAAAIGADRARRTRSRRSASYIGADSLGYLSLDGLLGAVGPTRRSYCTSCYTGRVSGRVSARTKRPTCSSR